MKITIECEDDIEFVNIEFVRPGQSKSIHKGTIQAVTHTHTHAPEGIPSPVLETQETVLVEPVKAYTPSGKKAVKDDYFTQPEGQEEREGKIDPGMANFTV